MMLTITYLITVFNKEKYIAKVIESLKAITEDFRKEFIFIDDGSTDKSIELIKRHTATLKNTIIVSQENQGPAIALNRGISLARGDYVFFVDGDDIITSEATSLLLKACNDFNTQVAFGARGKYDAITGEKFSNVIARRSLDRRSNPIRFLIAITQRSLNIIKNNILLDCHVANAPRNDAANLIQDPIATLLAGKIPRIRAIGSSGSLVKMELLKKVGGSDEEVFVQDFSLALKCALHSNFVHVNHPTSFEPISYDHNNLSSNKAFESYNSLKALTNFIKSNPQIAEQYKLELYRLLWSIMWKLNKYNFKTLYHYILSKGTNHDLSVSELLALYQENIKKLS